MRLFDLSQTFKFFKCSKRLLFLIFFQLLTRFRSGKHFILKWIICCFKETYQLWLLTHFSPKSHFYTPLKTSENVRKPIVSSVVMGYHEYRNLWTPIVGEVLQLRMEPDNHVDKYAVAVMNKYSVAGCLIKGNNKKFAITVFFFSFFLE